MSDNTLYSVRSWMDFLSQFDDDEGVHVQLVPQDGNNVWLMWAKGFSFGSNLNGDPKPGITIFHEEFKSLPDPSGVHKTMPEVLRDIADALERNGN